MDGLSDSNPSIVPLIRCNLFWRSLCIYQRHTDKPYLHYEVEESIAQGHAQSGYPLADLAQANFPQVQFLPIVILILFLWFAYHQIGMCFEFMWFISSTSLTCYLSLNEILQSWEHSHVSRDFVLRDTAYNKDHFVNLYRNLSKF